MNEPMSAAKAKLEANRLKDRGPDKLDKLGLLLRERARNTASWRRRQEATRAGDPIKIDPTTLHY